MAVAVMGGGAREGGRSVRLFQLYLEMGAR